MKGVYFMKLTDLILSAIIKKGVLYEARNVDTDVEIPVIVENGLSAIKINIKCDHMVLTIEKE